MSFTFDTRVCGIPAKIHVFNVTVVKGSFSYNAPSDLDYYGYTEFDYEIQDRRGRAAPWLERKLTTRDRDDLETKIQEQIHQGE